MSRPLNRHLQSGLTVEAEGDVEALHALAGSAFDQVVEGPRNDRLATLSLYVHQEEVRVARLLGGRALGGHFWEKLSPIKLRLGVLQLARSAFSVRIAHVPDPPRILAYARTA